jgi:Lar family restriction alleviation protein
VGKYNELKPCPFCGNDNLSTGTYPSGHWGDGPTVSYVLCEECDAKCEEHDDHTAPVKKWNSRADSAEKDKRIAELETERKILETTVQELRGTDWAAVNIESQERIAELEALLASGGSVAGLIAHCKARKIAYDKKGVLLEAYKMAHMVETILEAARLREGEKG